MSVVWIWNTEKSAVLQKPREGTMHVFTCSLGLDARGLDAARPAFFSAASARGDAAQAVAPEKRLAVKEKSQISEYKASFIDLWFGPLMIVLTELSHERCSRRCRPKRSNTDGNKKCKSPCSDQGRPWRGQFCQTRRRGKYNGYWVGSWTEQLATLHVQRHDYILRLLAETTPRFLSGSASTKKSKGCSTSRSRLLEDLPTMRFVMLLRDGLDHLVALPQSDLYGSVR